MDEYDLNNGFNEPVNDLGENKPEEYKAPTDNAGEENPVQPEAASDIQDAAEGSEPDVQEIAEGGEAPGEQEEEKANYYEPWREPVYREPENTAGAYTPNYCGTHYDGTPAPRKEKKKSSAGWFVRAVCLVLVCALAGGAAAYGVVELKLKDTGGKTVVIGSTASNDSSADSNTTPLSNGSKTAAVIYDTACRQTVGVRSSTTVKNVFGQTSSQAVTGSGMVISEDGYILTNYHVVEEYVVYGSMYDFSLDVIFHDGTAYPATVVGYDSDNDVAVLKIEASGLSAITVGQSSSMGVGDTVYTVGNPLGELTYTMTSGIVSALDRTISTDESTTIDVFQFDAAVNSGNSGGPVYNANGEVIGVVTAKYASTGVEGLGFAIPIDDAISIAKSLIENGYVTGKAYLGGNFMDVSSSATEYYNLPNGSCVVSINSGSPAEKAGLAKGDIITAIGSYEVTCTQDLQAALKTYSAGDTETVTAYRSGEYLEFSVTFGESAGTTPNTSVQQGSGGYGSGFSYGS